MSDPRVVRGWWRFATMLLYRDEVDQAATQARLAAIVGDELTTAK